MSVYIIEYLQEPSFISNTISKITGSRYSHSAMMIDNYWCELDAQDEYEGEPDYHVVEYDDIYHFLKTNPDKKRTVAFKVPHDFTSAEKIIGLDFWKNSEKNNIRYGYSKLFRFAYLSNFTPFLKAYYKWKKKPYIPIGDNDKYNVDDICWIEKTEWHFLLTHMADLEWNQLVTLCKNHVNKMKGLIEWKQKTASQS